MSIKNRFILASTIAAVSCLCIASFPNVVLAQGNNNGANLQTGGNGRGNNGCGNGNGGPNGRGDCGKKVPVPALLPGVAVLGGWVLYKKRKQNASNQGIDLV